MSWLESKAQKARNGDLDCASMGLLSDFVLEDYTAWACTYFGIRCGSLDLFVMGMKIAAPFFAPVNKTKYDPLLIEFLHDWEQMDADSKNALRRFFSYSMIGNLGKNMAGKFLQPSLPTGCNLAICHHSDDGLT
jgi:hypothetical protein